MFTTPFLGGFECSTHRRRDGVRLDVIAATGHDRQAAADYALLRRHGIATARDGLRWHLIEQSPGRYDWTSAMPQIVAARAAGMQVIWDLLHYGWPDWLDIWSDDFIARFADFAAAAAARIGPAAYIPINEISFLAWGGGDIAYLNPLATDRGPELKIQLCRAAIAATRRIRAAEPAATILTAEPLIHVTPAAATTAARDEAHALTGAQYEALDMLLGRRLPELGGGADLVDIVGLNFYPYNQFTTRRQTIARGEPDYVPLQTLLTRVATRYGKPLFIAETGCEGEARPEWLRYVAAEVRAANRSGAGCGGICLYPILDHPGWDNDRHCPNGLFSGMAEQRPVYAPLLDQLAIEQARGLAPEPAEMAWS